MIVDPFVLFDSWFSAAKLSEPNDPNAMALATSGVDGQPSVRMVLLKGHDPAGFIFYTNVESRKGNQLTQNTRAALLFHWKSRRQQVRIEGVTSSVSDIVADAYFATRSRDSQLGAWASDQSRALDSRATFEARFSEMAIRFDGQVVPRPPHWAGTLVAPERIEFWQDREHRLHERRLFTRDGQNWVESMLYP